METLYPCCAGLDVHKKTVVACVRRVGPGGRVRRQVRTFGTMTAQLAALADWLAAEGVTHAAMESTGVYWRPVFNLLEGRFEVLLVNARHIKQVPGRKTDVRDCEWIAQLLQHGLLRASFIPPRPQRELRELTRQRAQLVGERASVANRIQKVLEDANIKLGSVAADVLGLSGRDMIEAMIAGEEDPEALAGLARGRLRKKAPDLLLALRGRVTDHHRFLLRLLLDHLAALDALAERLGERIAGLVAPLEEAVARLDEVPGVNRATAECLVAEVGTDVGRFPSAAHLASWAGLCPGNNRSADRQRGGRTRPGNRWLRRALVQAAWAASAKKDSHLRARYRRLAARRGRKRAALAVAHTLLGVVYHLLRDGTRYRDLGPDHLGRHEPERLTRLLVRRLERLGHHVTLAPQAQPAGGGFSG